MFNDKNYDKNKVKYAIYGSVICIVAVLVLNYLFLSSRTEEITYNKFLDLFHKKRFHRFKYLQIKLSLFQRIIVE